MKLTLRTIVLVKFSRNSGMLLIELIVKKDYIMVHVDVLKQLCDMYLFSEDLLVIRDLAMIL